MEIFKTEYHEEIQNVDGILKEHNVEQQSKESKEIDTSEEKISVPKFYPLHIKRKAYNAKKWRLFTLTLLLIAPIIISLVSMLHLVEWFSIGNPVSLSIALAISYEILTIGTLLSLPQFNIFTFITRGSIVLVIIALTIMQIIGNVYSTFNHLNYTSMEVAAKLFGISTDGILISWIMGSMLPITSLLFLKLVANYWIKINQPKRRNHEKK